MNWLLIGIAAAVVVCALIAVAYTVGIYNTLVTLRNRFKNAYAQIDVQLKRRYDLIPNLVEIAKGYLTHERETLQNVTAARNQALAATSRVAADPTDADAMRQLVSAEGALAGGMGRLMMTMEAYPDLKANTTMQSLMEELTSTENKISFARQAYNDAVMVYNTGRETFPAVLLANMLGFLAATPFELSDAQQREAPKVAF